MSPRPRARLPLVLVVTFLVHVPVLGNGFVYDDNHVARAAYGSSVNPLIQELRPAGEYFANEYWLGVGQVELASNPLYRPVTVYSFALTHAVWPGRPNEDTLGPGTSEAFPHHLLNLLLQVTATGLVYLLAVRLTASVLASLAASLVFGVHSLHTEVVATCVGRADLFAFCFGLGALLLWLRGQDVARRGRTARFVASGMLLWLAFCSKESALPWLAAFPLFGVVLRWREDAPLGSAIARQLGLTVLAGGVPFVAWFLLRSAALADISGDWRVAYVTNPLFHAPAMERVLTAVKLWAHGLWQTLVPLRLASDWGPETFTLVAGPTDPWFLAGAAALAAMWIAALCSVRRQPVVFLAVAVWTGFSLPTSNVLFPIGTLYAERLYYAPALGLALAVAWLTARTAPRSRRIVLGVLLVWCAGASVRTFVRCMDWADNTTIFFRDVESQPRSLMLLNQAALSAKQLELEDRWRGYLERAIEVQPDLARTYLTLAHRSIEQGKYQEAEAMLERAEAAPIIHPVDGVSTLHYEYGLLYVFTNRYEKARAAFRKCLEASPRNPQHRHRILAGGIELFEEQEWWRILEEGERVHPDEPSWRYFRGWRAFLARDFEQAVRHWDASMLAVSPSYGTHVWQSWLDYAQSLARVGRVLDGQTVLRKLLAQDQLTDPRMRKDAQDMLKILRGG